MIEEALKLAEIAESLAIELPADWSSGEPKNIMTDISAMIRKLVEELDKQTKPTITKLDGKVVALTMTDDEHRIAEVLWEVPKPLSDEEIIDIWFAIPNGTLKARTIDFARAIEEKHGID